MRFCPVQSGYYEPNFVAGKWFGGCNFGHFIPSIQYLQSKNGTQFLSQDYPYVGSTNVCQTKGSVSRQIIGPTLSYTGVNYNDEAALLQAVSRGPVFVGINAAAQGFQYYASGVLNLSANDCDPFELDHAVTLVGYGYDSTTRLNYWKVKNSWSTTWGEGGYARIARGTNVCGIATNAYEATL
ncbi:unnamed protein product [Didymodactylos carnosus]|uniref:Peptidase C1A papain C-terminal domain-containing protein n=1 Tax=Didymodactylos carnosus TaxID=1234261 RepID=A0A8S2IYM6_9BILA|nr:unnamed protein product [Didymodactylos carnosus]CAF3786899.1 unnamed protein product [Didymodactylos carnosus]